MSIQNSINGAIDRSISHNETVTVRVGSEESMQDVFNELTSDDRIEDYDCVHATATLLEVWGTNKDGEEWRVHLMQDERVGAARFAE